MSKWHSETDKKIKFGIEAFGPIFGSGQKSGHPREKWAIGQMSSGRIANRTGQPQLF
jgi:hypothetical protein